MEDQSLGRHKVFATPDIGVYMKQDNYDTTWAGTKVDLRVANDDTSYNAGNRTRFSSCLAPVGCD